jgi:multicomponent Na+:H+ antiporter subunit A
VLLAGLGIVFGVVVTPIADLAESAGEATLGAPIDIHPAYHLDARAENLMALAAYGVGALLVVSRVAWLPAAAWLARLGEQVGPARLYQESLSGLDRFSDRIHRVEVRDLRAKVAAVLGPTAILVGAALIASFAFDDFTVGRLRWADVPIVLVLAMAAASAVATTLPRDHLATALVLSGVGFSLAVFYTFYGAPNVALVAVLIETIFAVLFLGMLALLPPSVAKFAVSRWSGPTRRWRDPALAVVAGLFAFVVAWSVLSRPASRESVASQQIELTPAAHAKDVVTAILADFRGLDTLGEITVLLIALVGLASLLRRGELR